MVLPVVIELSTFLFYVNEFHILLILLRNNYNWQHLIWEVFFFLKYRILFDTIPKLCWHNFNREIFQMYFNQKKSYWFRGGAALKIVPGLRGVQFFYVCFYCISERFAKVTHLVNLKKCRGSSPGCPGWCAAPGKYWEAAS